MDAVPWMAEIGLISWRTAKYGKRPPLPSEILATFVIFGAFSLIPNKRVGAALGWGIVVASALNLLPEIVSGPSSQDKVSANPSLQGPVIGRDTQSDNSPFQYGPSSGNSRSGIQQ